MSGNDFVKWQKNWPEVFRPRCYIIYDEKTIILIYIIVFP